ncbi:exo-beta-N-acetylmuramidase NamZ family protein [Actinokineospora sp. HUAS TT18]|uniref:exo-beta-N-acetylmuramidase NamZ family protein n=1 Tax=Actinokineospora sp. HUAS TT18 TaxID=3447451 RepID=UPI003F522CD5
MDRRRFLAASALAAPLLTAAAAPVATARTEETHGPTTPAADRLAAQGWRSLAGRRVGVVSNPTGVLRDGTHVVDSMVAAGVSPVAVFGPEHGFRGTAQAGGSEGDYLDPRTGLPVYDTYGKSVAAVAAQFRKAGIDTVVFDIADVGARFYTYIWTLHTAMGAAAGLDFVVLDRPNPIGGAVRGPRLDSAFASGVGREPIVQQHGMTVGELAGLFAGEFLPGAPKPRVERVTGWRRDQLDTGLAWVPPSPNMPTPQTALVYPGTCLFEGTTFSEGRGTTRPFEIIGAPGIDWRWAEELNALGLAGVRFREHYFVPTFGKFVGTACGGVQVHVTDPRRFEAIETAVAMIVTAKRGRSLGWRPDNFIDKLTGSDRFRRMIDAGAGVAEVTGSWAAELAEFRVLREPYLLYR